MSQEPEEDWARFLSDREAMVCRTICEASVPIGFNEIRRRTGLHQEIVSRILKRLLFMCKISRNDIKYQGCAPCSQQNQ